ncbi:MAG: O-antigen ligase family protein [Anaerolineae bacterium]|nr:O-antigen ligase family protein [Anaerolineae bacterium]
MLLGILLGLGLAFLIANEVWHFAIPLALIVPVAVLLNKYPFGAVMLWLLLFPFFVYEPTTAGRYIYWVLHRALIPAALAITILSDWAGASRRRSVRLGVPEAAMLAFLGLVLVNIFLFSSSTTAQIYRWYDLLFVPFCMYWLIRLCAPTEQDLKRLLWVAGFAVLAQCTIGLTSWFAPQVLPSKWITGLEGARTVGSLRNPAVYTSTLLFLALLLFQHAVTCKTKWLRLVLLSIVGLALFCVFFSFSRGSWVGGAIVFVALIFFHPKTMIRFAVILIGLAITLSSTVLASEVSWAYERVSGEDAQSSAESRLVTNNASLQMILAKPLLGWGFGNYDKYDRRFQTRTAGVAVINDDTSHNTYLTVVAELGIVGLLLYLFPSGWWFIWSTRGWRRLPAEGFLDRRLFASLWLLLLHMFIVTNLMDMIRFHFFGTTIWWMALAFIANMASSVSESVSVMAPIKKRPITGWI